MVGEERALVGRQPELEQLLRWLERARSECCAFLITGAAGVGKTTVWRRGSSAAAGEGFTVLAARPGESEAPLAYSGLADLLEGVEPERFDRLPMVQSRSLDVALLRREADEAGVDARAVATALLSVLRGLSEEAPVLVAVDDAQWLDASTASVLAYALRRLDRSAVGVLATVRTGDRSPATFADALAAGRRVETALPPLSVAALHSIIRGELGWAPPRPTLVKIATASDGNPFHALEIARELMRVESGAADGRLPAPAQSRELVRARLSRLPPATRTALLTAACLAAPTTALVGEDALAPAEEAGLVRIDRDGRIRFAHPLIASGVYELASAAGRRKAHRELARHLTDPEERARHLALGTGTPNEHAAAVVEEAAQRAHARGAPADAAELMGLALELTPGAHGEDRARRLVLAAGMLFHAGDLARARELLDEALAGPADARTRALALRLVGQLHARRSSFGEAVELLTAARAAAADDAALAAEIELDLAFHRSNIGDFATGEVHARAAVPLAEAAGSDGLLACALAVRTVITFLRGGGIAEADLAGALRLADPRRDIAIAVRPRFVEGFLMLCVGRLDESIATLEALRADTLEQGRESDVPLLWLYLVWATLWRGDVRRATALADDALETAALLDDRLADALTLSASALAHAYAGEDDRTRVDADAAIEHFERLGWWAGTIWPRWARSFLELSLGRPAAAHEALRPLTELLANVGPGDPAVAMFLPDDVEALIELGRLDEAEALLGPFRDASLRLGRGWAIAAAGRCDGLVHAGRGDLEAAVQTLEQALTDHERSPMPFERARTLLALGVVRRRRKERRLARLAFEEAVGLFEALGTPLWAARARAELARAGSRRAPEGLTATEERIARLAAEGLSNRAIAEQAFVSVKTVETNLKRAYRKLGISSRAQLARALDQGPPPNS